MDATVLCYYGRKGYAIHTCARALARLSTAFEKQRTVHCHLFVPEKPLKHGPAHPKLDFKNSERLISKNIDDGPSQADAIDDRCIDQDRSTALPEKSLTELEHY